MKRPRAGEGQLPLDLDLPPRLARAIACKAEEIARKAKEIAEITALGGKCIVCGERRIYRLRLDYGQYGRNPPRVLCCSCRNRR